MLKKFTFIRYALFVFGAFLFCSAIVNGQTNRPVGINLVEIQDWSEEFVFVDVMKQSREWIAHGLAAGSDWSSEVEVPLRPDGYPLEIPYDNGTDPEQGVRSLMYFGELENIYPEGEYLLEVDGTGVIELWGGATGTFTCPISTVVTVDNTSGGIALEILESQVADPIHNIRLVMPGFENVFETNPYHPELIDFLEDFQLIRFMDWMKTNNSNVASWSDRTLPTDRTQTAESGVAYEHIAAMCNLLQKDAWINVPHQADDNYITEFARFLRDELDPALKIYIEYSNEVWNEIFEQNVYASEQANLLGYPGEPWEQAWTYTGKRSADVFQIFENEFVDDSRFIKVIPGFSASPYISNFVVDSFNDPLYNPSQVTADAIAIAPYFGGALGDDISDQGLQNSITVDQLVDSLELRLPEAYMYMADSKLIADNNGLDLIAYEGGQHLVANFPNNTNESFVEKLLDVNRHAAMSNFYCDYFDQWYDVVGGGMFAHFSSHGGYNQFGSWGLKESYDDLQAPKYVALQNCVFNQNETASLADAELDINSITIFPNPVEDIFTIKGLLSQYEITIVDVNEQEIANYSSSGSTISIKVKDLPNGLYFVRIENLNNSDVRVQTIVKM